MSTKPIIAPPSIDEHALEYLRLREVCDLAKQDLDAYKSELVKLVTKVGTSRRARRSLCAWTATSTRSR